jgi:folate-binding protein YgfZ
MLTSVLHPLHKSSDARIVLEDGWLLPAGFSNMESEIRAARQGVTIADRSHMGRLELRGEDTLDLLNRLSTNQLDLLRPGDATNTVLTTNKGRIIDQLLVAHLDSSIMITTSPQRSAHVSEWIDRYTIIEDTTIGDLSQTTAMITLLGPKAANLIKRVFGESPSFLEIFNCITISWGTTSLTLVRADPFGVPSYDIIVPVEEATTLWLAIQEAGKDDAVQPVGEDALEYLRVVSGKGRWGRDFDETNNPLEAGLTDAISWTKGCYIGQEVIARLWTYHKVQKFLVSVDFPEAEQTALPAELQIGGMKAGILTSYHFEPETRTGVGLGYLRTAYADHGQLVEIPSDAGRSMIGKVTRVASKPTAAVPSVP